MSIEQVTTRWLALLCVVAAPTALAETRSPGLFSYTGQLSAPVTNVGWELSPTRAQAEGVNIAFWGAPDPGAGCPALMQDGATTSNLFWTNVAADTGLSLGGAQEQWAPLSGPGCALSNWQGFSHAHVRNSSTDGGIGIYSHTGPKPTDPSLAFFLPYPASGDRNRANPYIQGTFATFRNAPWTPSSRLTRPFSGNSTDANLVRVALRSHQGLARFVMEDAARQQIRQQTTATFLNLACLANNTNAGRKCQIQYLVLNAIAGVNAASGAGLISDPSQGGIPAVFGPSGSEGQTTYVQTTPAWTSWAAPTQGGTWAGQKWFQVEISFNQFLGMLRLATQRMGHSPTDANVNLFFGPSHDDRNQWVLLDVGVAHEVYNPSMASKRAYVGGNVTELSVIALPY